MFDGLCPITIKEQSVLMVLYIPTADRKCIISVSSMMFGCVKMKISSRAQESLVAQQ